MFLAFDDGLWPNTSDSASVVMEEHEDMELLVPCKAVFTGNFTENTVKPSYILKGYVDSVSAQIEIC